MFFFGQDGLVRCVHCGDECVHEADCLGGFVKANPRAEAAHCPALCASRKDVERHGSGFGSSSLAAMQDHAVGCMR